MREDPFTGEQFVPKRITQRFAKPENRIAFHNSEAKKLRHSVSHINKPLHRNLRILDQLMQNKADAIIHKQFLLGKGFSFGVHTHYVKHNGKLQIAVYQYAIIQHDNDQIKIIEHD